MPHTDTAPSPRVRILAPLAAPPEGLSVLRLDLAAVFTMVEAVGRDEALLLVTVKALRQRTGTATFHLHDLAWMLQARSRHVQRWLNRLTHARYIVYDVQVVGERTTVTVELVETDEGTPFAVHYDVPTHWFVQTLPVVGRAAFATFLYALARENGSVLQLDHLVRSVRLRGRLHGRYVLWRLRRHRLLIRDGGGAFVVADPPPPTSRTRKQLLDRASPTRRRALTDLAFLSAALLVFSSLALALLLRIR